MYNMDNGVLGFIEWAEKSLSCDLIIIGQYTHRLKEFQLHE